MKILAIDPAARCGFAHSNGKHGVWDLIKTFDRCPGDRLIRFERFLEVAISEWGCDLLAAEDASFGSNNRHTAATHNELRGVIHMVAARREIDVKLFGPSTIKAFATDNGRAKKHHMIAALKRLIGIAVVSDDEADALWILELAKRPDCWTPTKQQKRAAKKREKKLQPTLFR